MKIEKSGTYKCKIYEYECADNEHPLTISKLIEKHAHLEDFTKDVRVKRTRDVSVEMGDVFNNDEIFINSLESIDDDENIDSFIGVSFFYVKKFDVYYHFGVDNSLGIDIKKLFLIKIE